MVTTLLVALATAGTLDVRTAQAFEPLAPVPYSLGDGGVDLARVGADTVVLWVDERLRKLDQVETAAARSDVWFARYRADAGVLGGQGRSLCTEPPGTRVLEPRLASANTTAVAAWKHVVSHANGSSTESLRYVAFNPATVSPPRCGTAVLPVTDAGHISSHDVFVSAGRRLLVWVEGRSIYARRIEPNADAGTEPFLLGTAAPGAAPLQLSGAGAGDGGFLVSWTDQESVQATLVAVDDRAGSSIQVLATVDAGSLTLDEGAPEPLGVAVNAFGAVEVASLSDPATASFRYVSGLPTPLLPSLLVASQDGGAVLVFETTTTVQQHTAWLPLTGYVAGTSGVPPALRALAMTRARGEEVHVLARRLPGGALVVVPRVPEVADEPAAVVTLKAPEQGLPSLALRGDGGWLVVWNELEAPADAGTQGRRVVARTALLDLEGTAAPGDPLPGVDAGAFRAVVGSPTGDRAAVLSLEAGGEWALRALDGTPHAPAAGSQVLLQSPFGERAALGNLGSIQWGADAGVLLIQSSAGTSAFNGSSPSRCAAVAGGSIWLPTWNDMTGLAWVEVPEGANAGQPTMRRPLSNESPPSPPRAPCAAARGDEVATVWSHDDGSIRLLVTTVSELRGSPMVAGTSIEVAAGTPVVDENLNPVVAPLGDGWLVVWEHLHLDSKMLYGAYVDANGDVLDPWTAMHAEAIEHAPLLSATPGGPVALAWRGYDTTADAWAVRVRVIAGPLPTVVEDAGLSDAGVADGGEVDAGTGADGGPGPGTGDGGALDGGGQPGASDGGADPLEPVVFTTCGCSAANAVSLVGLWGLLLLARRGRATLRRR